MDGSRDKVTSAQDRDAFALLKPVGVIEIPCARGSEFDHGIFDPGSGRVFIAHTARSTIEVIDPAAGRHMATFPDFPGAAGAVADDGEILITNRGSASIAWLDGRTLKTKAVMKTGPRPNGAAIVKRLGLGIAACIGDESEKPTLQAFRLDTASRQTLNLPGRPRWCVTDAAAERLFLCIREPSMILVAGLPDLKLLEQWKLPSDGAHGLDIDHTQNRLYAACDDGHLVEVDSGSGDITNSWPIAGPPDVTFFNPASGRVHVAIGDPGLVETIEPKTGRRSQTETGPGAHTTVLVPPDRLYVISPAHGGVLVLAD